MRRHGVATGPHPNPSPTQRAGEGLCARLPRPRLRGRGRGVRAGFARDCANPYFSDSLHLLCPGVFDSLDLTVSRKYTEQPTEATIDAICDRMKTS